MGTDRLVGGRQAGGEPGRRLSGEVRQAEDVAHRVPLPSEQLEVGALSRGIGRVQLLKYRQLRVGGGQNARVDQAEQPRPLRPGRRKERLLADGVGGVNIAGQFARRGRGRQLVVCYVLSHGGRRVGPQQPDRGNGDNSERKPDAESSQRADRSSSESPHLSLSTRRSRREALPALRPQGKSTKSITISRLPHDPGEGRQ